VASDPGSAWNHLELAVALDDAGRYDEARIAADRSLEIRELPNARLVRARIAIAHRRFADAERDLVQLLDPARQVADAYTLYQGYEALAVARERTRQLAGAAEALRHGRRRLPIYAAALTEKLAVILYLQGDRPAALAELEAHREGALSETLPESRQVLYRIGLLYAEAGRKQEARRAFEEFLRATENLADPSTREIRKLVAKALRPPG
jgi:tetratricopeptide (TPR) repeat protein